MLLVGRRKEGQRLTFLFALSETAAASSLSSAFFFPFDLLSTTPTRVTSSTSPNTCAFSFPLLTACLIGYSGILNNWPTPVSPAPSRTPLPRSATLPTLINFCCLGAAKPTTFPLATRFSSRLVEEDDNKDDVPANATLPNFLRSRPNVMGGLRGMGSSGRGKRRWCCTGEWGVRRPTIN